MQARILWIDDEIEHLKPHILFLKEKGYEVIPAKSGDEAIDIITHQKFDLVFLDENMPGLSGLKSLQYLKEKYPALPVIMITKSDEETLMDQAIGGKISDFLIKPVSPMQILPVIKKHVEKKRIMTEHSTLEYQQQFRQISMQISPHLTFEEWGDLYRKLVYFEIALQESGAMDMLTILYDQKREANSVFCRWVEQHYIQWLHQQSHAPVLSHTLFQHRIFPLIKKYQGIFLILIDNLRYDQWKVLEKEIAELYWTEIEEIYCSILPTTTQYARNALFAGLMPSEIQKLYPDIWLNDGDDGGKNQYEHDLLLKQMKRLGLASRASYYKVLNHKFGEKLVNEIANLGNNLLNVVIFNFIDMLSHAGTDTQIVKELAKDESAYRSTIKSWFEHSPLKMLLQKLNELAIPVILTTDHGSVQIKNPVPMVGDKNVNPNLRYKQGKALSYDEKNAFTIADPLKAFLPKTHLNQKFVFARNNDYFVYQNNYHHYVRYYQDTFQHGGISMEEMLIPFVLLLPRGV